MKKLKTYIFQIFFQKFKFSKVLNVQFKCLQLISNKFVEKFCWKKSLIKQTQLSIAISKKNFIGKNRYLLKWSKLVFQTELFSFFNSQIRGCHTVMLSTNLITKKIMSCTTDKPFLKKNKFSNSFSSFMALLLI